MERVIITTGGTGGHIFPALAVAEELQDRYPDVEILFLGGSRGPEKRIVREAGLNFRALPAKGVLGRGIRSLGSIFWMSRSAVISWSILRSFKPDVILGLGGYAGFIPVLVGTWMNFPTAIHEQNSIPGITNRLLGKRVDEVYLSYPDEHDFFNEKKVIITGNPVRKSLLELRENIDHGSRRKNKNMLVLGGSQGAKGINAAVRDALPSFKAQGINVWHQCGKSEYKKLCKAYEEAGMSNSKIEPFIDDMAEAYSWADIVVCRAGASTIAELTAIGVPSILIPYPYATHGHQLNNAKQLEAAGAAMVLVQSYLEEINLARAVDDLLSMPEQLSKMAVAAKKMGNPDSAAHIVKNMQALKERKKGKK